MTTFFNAEQYNTDQVIVTMTNGNRPDQIIVIMTTGHYNNDQRFLRIAMFFTFDINYCPWGLGPNIHNKKYIYTCKEYNIYCP